MSGAKMRSRVRRRERMCASCGGLCCNPKQLDVCCVQKLFYSVGCVSCPVLSAATEPHAMKPTGRARHGGRYPATLGLDLGHRYWLRGRA